MSENKQPLSSVILRPAEKAEACVAALLHRYSLAERVPGSEDPKTDAAFTKYYGERMALGDPYFLASVPHFATAHPVLDQTAQQLAGFMALSLNKDRHVVGINYLYTVKSGYPAGSALLLSAIDYADRQGCAEINLKANHFASAKWYKDQGFEFVNAIDRFRGGPMRLYRENFTQSREKINFHTKIEQNSLTL